MNALKRWDIFCKIVDNFGDIGVCWRLARQLQVEHDLQIRLWVDDLESAQKIILRLNLNKNQQLIDNIAICHWTELADFNQAADVVIEAFACDLPPTYLASMSQKKSTWINLEYLSAEPWVDDFHAKPSPQSFLNSANGLTRHFYFPGFTEKTGGLIRETGATKQYNRIQNRLHTSLPRKREPILAMNSTWIPAFAGMTEGKALKSKLQISLFCYPNAPISDLLDALQQYLLSPQNITAEAGYSCVKPNSHAVLVYVPQSSILPNVAAFFGKKNIKAGDKLVKNNLTVEVLPFLSQAGYDQLLRDCDLNFVRGEDSWIRAIWAGKPFIWQPYMQDENAHMKKLDAFLNVFYGKNELACEAHRYWSAGLFPKATLDAYLANLKHIHAHTQLQAAKFANQQDLAAKLVIFCNKLAFTKE